jgi:hypothetical protein
MLPHSHEHFHRCRWQPYYPLPCQLPPCQLSPYRPPPYQPPFSWQPHESYQAPELAECRSLTTCRKFSLTRPSRPRTQFRSRLSSDRRTLLYRLAGKTRHRRRYNAPELDLVFAERRHAPNLRAMSWSQKSNLQSRLSASSCFCPFDCNHWWIGKACPRKPRRCDRQELAHAWRYC